MNPDFSSYACRETAQNKTPFVIKLLGGFVKRCQNCKVNFGLLSCADMKKIYLFIAMASMITASCGGGGGGSSTASPSGASSSSSNSSSSSSDGTKLPSLVECMTPKVGVRFEWQGDTESGWLSTDPNRDRKETRETINHVFEGTPSIGVKQTGDGSTFVSEYRLDEQGNWLVLGDYDYSNTDITQAPQYTSVNQPPISISPNIQVGQTVEQSWDEKHSGSSVTYTNYKESLTFLGHEDILLGDGKTTLKNVCKIKIKEVANTENSDDTYGIVWTAPGYGIVYSEEYSSTGTKTGHGLVTQVFQAP